MPISTIETPWGQHSSPRQCNDRRMVWLPAQERAAAQRLIRKTCAGCAVRKYCLFAVIDPEKGAQRQELLPDMEMTQQLRLKATMAMFCCRHRYREGDDRYVPASESFGEKLPSELARNGNDRLFRHMLDYLSGG